MDCWNATGNTNIANYIEVSLLLYCATGNTNIANYHPAYRILILKNESEYMQLEVQIISEEQTEHL
jgi:hypothetical protein